jgi:LmbE family N-acetylglucosaminyl deacetylase
MQFLMQKCAPWRRYAPIGKGSWTVVLLGSLAFTLASAQAAKEKVLPTAPLPQDTGVAGLKLKLRELATTGRLMQVVAHPDDEDGGVLTLEARGQGVSVTLLTLTRGEGGQNKVGSNLFDVLGVLRTLELLGADRYYGVQQRFTRVADFGYSKTPEETFQKWQGHDVALGDMVRVIRRMRPDVLVARFSGTERDGHGHHQVSSLLAREAFRAAADPAKFPEQIKEGLPAWQARKLYIGNVCPWGAKTCPGADYTVSMNTGKQDDLLGTSYVQFAMMGLKHQLSQGAGGWTVDPGDRFAFYKLVDSVLPSTLDKDGHEQSFFDGIDTTLPGLVARLGNEQETIPALKSQLEAIQKKIEEATAAADKDPLAAVDPLTEAGQLTGALLNTIQTSKLTPEAALQIMPPLQVKIAQITHAIQLATGASLTVTADVPVGANPDDAFMAVPGQTFSLTAHYSTRDPRTKQLGMRLELPPGWESKVLDKKDEGNENTGRFEVTVGRDAAYTRPYWHRNDPETETINTIDDPSWVTVPLPAAPVSVAVLAGHGGVMYAPCMVKYKNADGEIAERAVAVAPPFSIEMEPATAVVRMNHGGTTDIKVRVKSNIKTSENATLKLDVPRGWNAQPGSTAISFAAPGEAKEVSFHVKYADVQEGRAQIKASVEYQGKAYDLGYSVVTRPDLDTFYYYQPAVERVSVVDVKVPESLKIGYVMGAGDDIPPVLTQLGINVTVVPAEHLATEDLSKYGTIVLGIRTYDTQKDVASNNSRLLDFVKAGGTLVVQYDTGVGEFNSKKFAPYPAQLSRARVSVEEAPVEILAPEDSVFHTPNEITQNDFQGWVQERGLYFMSSWDAAFKPLLASHDPGEDPQKGGLLRAQYGKGTYIYTGYAFFRQLPAGVPGAVRLYMNLLDAGH